MTQLRGFLGLTNYYSSYVPHYADFSGPLTYKLRLNRQEGRKGSTVKLVWKQGEIEAFEQLKKVLAQNLELHRMDPDAPFVLRTDASDKAIGAVLEQDRELAPGQTPVRVPVGFFSRKLSKSQLNWTPREKETYAVVSALQKWAGWIGLQPVLIVTDHKSLENWVEEKRDTPSGPGGRRGRWHEILSKFDLTVVYVPGRDNVVADAMSRYAYPASKAFQDVSVHGSAEAAEEMKVIIAEERREERLAGMHEESESTLVPPMAKANSGIPDTCGEICPARQDHEGEVPPTKIDRVEHSWGPNASVVSCGPRSLSKIRPRKRRGRPIEDPDEVPEDVGSRLLLKRVRPVHTRGQLRKARVTEGEASDSGYESSSTSDEIIELTPTKSPPGRAADDPPGGNLVYLCNYWKIHQKCAQRTRMVHHHRWRPLRSLKSL